jgi:hypothetical protein
MDLFKGGGAQPQPMYLPPPPPPNPVQFADATKAPGYKPSLSLMGGAATNATSPEGVTGEASTTRKTLLGQ